VTSSFHRGRGTRREDFERPWSGAFKGAFIGYGGAILGGFALLAARAPLSSRAVLAGWAVGGFLGGALGGALFGWRHWKAGTEARWRDILLVIPAFGLACGYLAYALALAGGQDFQCTREAGRVACRFEERRWLGLGVVRENAREDVRGVRPFVLPAEQQPRGFVLETREFEWIVDDFGPEPLGAVQAFLPSAAPSLALERNDWPVARMVGLAGLGALALGFVLLGQVGRAG
jgi:hypothetical protein